MLGIFLDTETNGLNPRKHKILEIAYKILDIETGEAKLSFEQTLTLSEKDWENSDRNSLKVNGFTWEEVRQGVLPEVSGKTILSHFEEAGIKRGNAVFVCQNPSFDRAFFGQLIDPDIQEKLLWPYHWLDLASMHWAKAISLGESNPTAYPWNTGVSKDKIARAYGLPSEKTPHRAMHGVEHLILCYQAVIGFPKSLHGEGDSH